MQTSYSLKSLKGGIMEGTIIGAVKGDTRSLDYSSDYTGDFPSYSLLWCFAVEID